MGARTDSVSYNGVIGCFWKVGDQRIVGASGFIKEFGGCGFREERATTVQVTRKMAGCFGQLFTSVSGMAGGTDGTGHSRGCDDIAMEWWWKRGKAYRHISRVVAVVLVSRLPKWW